MFQLAAGAMTEPGACAPAIVRRQLGNSGFGRGFFHDVPDDLLRDAFSPGRALPTGAPEQRPRGDLSRRGPTVDRRFYLTGHWHRADVRGFANQISDHPPLLPLLEVLDGEVRDLTPP